jgi:hypothetical protein
MFRPLLLATAVTTAGAIRAWQGSIRIASGAGEKGPSRQNASRYDYVDDATVALAPGRGRQQQPGAGQGQPGMADAGRDRGPALNPVPACTRGELKCHNRAFIADKKIVQTTPDTAGART